MDKSLGNYLKISLTSVAYCHQPATPVERFVLPSEVNNPYLPVLRTQWELYLYAVRANGKNFLEPAAFPWQTPFWLKCNTKPLFRWISIKVSVAKANLAMHIDGTVLLIAGMV